jgi:uncharacterized membrane protein
MKPAGTGCDGAMAEHQAHLWQSLQRGIATAEGKVFLAGVIMTSLYAAAILLAGLRSPAMFRALLTTTTTHIVAGRAAGMSWGYAHGLPTWIVVVANMAIETFLVLLFYPLFVLSYQKLVVVKPLRQAMERIQRTAQALQPKIMKYGIPGLLVFVWFPFWMTGPLVGVIIGFLIGMRLWVNLSVVLTGTYLAILCWSVVLRQVQDRLSAVGPLVPFFFVGAVLLLAIAIHVRYAFSPQAAQGGDEGAGNTERDGGQDAGTV